MITGIYFNAETRSFSAEQREFTNVEQMKTLKPVYEAYKSKGGKLGFADWVKKNKYGVDNATPIKHGLTKAEVKTLDTPTRNAVAKSLRESNAKKGSLNVHGPSMASQAIKAKMNLNTPGVKGAAIGAGVVAAGAGAAYAANRIIAARKAKKAKEAAATA